MVVYFWTATNRRLRGVLWSIIAPPFIHGGDAQRAYFGRVGDGSVVLRLKDKQGRDRIVLQVNADGTPVLQLLDANGKMTAQLPPQDHR